MRYKKFGYKREQLREQEIECKWIVDAIDDITTRPRGVFVIMGRAFITRCITPEKFAMFIKKLKRANKIFKIT